MTGVRKIGKNAFDQPDKQYGDNVTDEVTEMMRKGSVLAAVMIGIFMLSGCGRVKDQPIKNIKIGISVYDQYDTFVSQMMTAFNAYAMQKQEETGITINVEIYNSSGSQSTQNEQVESMIKEGCNVVCVNLVDRTDPTAIIDAAEKNNVPVIFFNRELVEEDLGRWDKLYYVGAEAFESGIMEGELAAEAFHEQAKLDKNQDGIFQYIVLEGEVGHQDAIVRTEYSVNTMIQKGVSVEKLGYAIANWNRAQAQTKMNQLLEEYGGQIELVLANNDDMALGAIDALKAQNIPQSEWPAVVGIDGTDVGLEAVRNGEMIGTVYNDKEGQAAAMLELACTLSTDGAVSSVDKLDGKTIRLPYIKVSAKEAENFTPPGADGY